VEGFSRAPLNKEAVPRATDAFRHFHSSFHIVCFSISTDDSNSSDESITIFQQMTKSLVSEDYAKNPAELRKYVQYITLFRVGLPALAVASASCLAYSGVSTALAGIIDDSGAFGVIAQDSSQFIQNILTTCGLMFSILVGYTYYFLYQQQESIYLALFEEVTVAKSLLEQISLVCEGRKPMYRTILQCVDRYVRDDLTQFSVEPSVLLSSRPIDDPLEDIMYLTSVGEPSVVYQTVRSLRQARARRLGALQRKLPQIHMILLFSLAAIVLCTFPLLGAGVQTIGEPGILSVQSWYFSFIVFGIACAFGVINELNRPSGDGAYNVITVLSVMVTGLEEELEGRLADKYLPSGFSPTNDVTNPSSDDLAVEVYAQAQIPKGAYKEDGTSSPWIGKRIANRIRNRRKD
jgi:hypothetical protein